MPSIVINKQALHDYTILDTISAGIVLTGAETKSVRLGHISLKGSYITIHDEEVWLTGAHISRYGPAGPISPHDPTRSRKLLMRSQEIARLIGKIDNRY